jgi:hypothetical protein
MSHSEYAMARPAAQGHGGRFAEAGRRASPFRALVWKEWREQRLIWAALLALSFAVEVALRLTPATAPAREVLLLLIPFLWGSMATLLGANAFAGDRETDTESFMGALPVSRRFRFWVKIGVVAALLWAVQALTALCTPETDWSRAANSQPTYFMYYLLVSFSLGMILFSLTAACVASWSSSTFSAFLQTAVAGPCLLLWMAFMGKLLYAMLDTWRIGADAKLRWSALATALVLAHAVMLAGAYWLWTAADGGFFRHVRRAATLLALFLFVLLAAPAIVYARATWAAPVFPEGFKWIAPSPAGRYALINSLWPEGPWHLNDRTVLLDTETARTVRLSRLRESAIGVYGGTTFTKSREIWSPDGARFVFTTSNQWAFPYGCLDRFPPWVTGYLSTSWWVDAADGEAHYVRSSSGWDAANWWWDDHTLAFHEGTGMVFQDIRTGERRFCADKLSATQMRLLSFPDARASATGIWVPSSWRELYCYRPDATVASVVEVQKFPSVLLEAGIYFESVSSDGRWATFWTGNQVGQHAWMISLKTGVTGEVLPVGRNLLGGYLRESFTADSKAILACGRQGIGLWDMGERKLEMLYTAPPNSQLLPEWFALSPSGKYLLVNLSSSESGFDAVETDVVDIATKRAWPVWNMNRERWFATVMWLGDDQLVAYENERGPDGGAVENSLWVMNRDGTSKRKVLP